MEYKDVESRWYDALYYEDCVRVRDLLKENPDLVKQGWDEEPKKELDWFRKKGKNFAWSGRTALHVGARRGSAELVRQVLTLVEEKQTSRSNSRDKASSLSGEDSERASTSEPSRYKRPPIHGRSMSEQAIHGKSTSEQLGVLDHQRFFSSSPDHDQKIVANGEIHEEGKVYATTADVARNRIFKSTLDRKKTLKNVPGSLADLLAAKDGEYVLDALAMAVVNGNVEIVDILSEASLKCGSNPYEITWVEQLGELSCVPNAGEKKELKAKEELRAITELVLARSGEKDRLLREYSLNRDLNFLPWQEYFFHFTFMAEAHDDEDCKNVRLQILQRTATSLFLQRFLSELRDGQGRTALHVAIDEDMVEDFFEMVRAFFENYFEQNYDISNIVPRELSTWMNDWVKARDGGGRTPFHRAAALGKYDAVECLVRYGGRPWIDSQTDSPSVEADLHKRTNATRLLSLDDLSRRNGLNGKCVGGFSSKILHDAIIHRNSDIVRSLFRYEDEKDHHDRVDGLTQHDGNVDRLNLPCTRWVRIEGQEHQLELEPLELAVLVGDAAVVQSILKNIEKEPPDSCWPPSWSRNLHHFLFKNQYQRRKHWPAIHLVAARGDFGLMKLFLGVKTNYDPLVKDKYGNTALHCATAGTEVHFHTHLLDYINCGQIAFSVRQSRQQGEGHVHKERQGCVNLLLHAGLDPWGTNDTSVPPHPGPNMPSTFISWWFEKIEKEILKFNSATNAISITAALIATASYVGPMQPPLSYAINPSTLINEMQVDIMSVKLFAIFNNLSFFFAVAAIITCLIPSLPMAEQSMMDELRRTRRMVTLGVGLLFPSIIFVLAAFGSASIAVIPVHGSWSSNGLSVITTMVGSSVCLCVILLFFLRFLGIIFHKYPRVRRVYNVMAF